MNQEKLREDLIAVVGSGLNARAIARYTGITYDILAKFKQNKLCLTSIDANKLEKYLLLVQIPTSI